MKNNLGNILLFILSFIMLQAEDFNYSFKADNHTPYVKEAVILTLDFQQTNPDIVLFFNFSIKKSQDYVFQRLDTLETDMYHNTKAEYKYLLYPLKSGEIKIEFNLLKKVTNDESVAYSFSGDRDNTKILVTTDTNIPLTPLSLHVKPLPKDTALVGDFNLTYSIKKHKATAYEPLPFQVTIKGLGYPPLLKHLLPKEGNFTRFTQKPVVHSSAGIKGTESTVTYSMALSHHENFRLSAITIKAFNPKTEKSYLLGIPAQEFEITKTDLNTLVDKTDLPKPLSTDWSWLSDILSYFIVFTAGYLSALIWKGKRRDLAHKNNPLKEKIQHCKDEKALLQLLMAHDSQKFKLSIEKLENALYGDGKIHLSKIKQEAQDLL